MLDVARKRARQELHDLWAIARRNPLTVAGICIGLIIPVFVLHGVEGQISSVRRTTMVDHERVVRVSACATHPDSHLCLVGITQAIRTCRHYPRCRALLFSPLVPEAQTQDPPVSTDVATQR